MPSRSLTFYGLYFRRWKMARSGAGFRFALEAKILIWNYWGRLDRVPTCNAKSVSATFSAVVLLVVDVIWSCCLRDGPGSEVSAGFFSLPSHRWSTDCRANCGVVRCSSGRASNTRKRSGWVRWCAAGLRVRSKIKDIPRVPGKFFHANNVWKGVVNLKLE